MMYEYMEFADQTLVTHSRVLGEGNSETVQVHFERPKMGGFDSARCELPSYRWLLFRYARVGGILSSFEQKK